MSGILIIGGGIAGTAAALALHKAGFEATVHEAYPHGAEDIGAFLTLADNGMRALAQLDAAEAVADTGFPLTAMRVIDAAGAEVAAVPLGDPASPLTSYRCLLRSELNRVLQAEARRRGIVVRHSARLVGLAEDADGVTASFADGSSAEGSLLIGADGLNSTVRTLLHPGGPEPRYAGQRVFYGYSPGARPEDATERITMIRSDTAAFGYAVSPKDETFWFARVSGGPASAAELAAGTVAQWRGELVSRLRRDDTPAADIVAATGDRLMLTNACDLPVGTPWHTPTGRALIIGDAAHAASPATGQGASMALEDAVVLAKALRDLPSTTAALAAYQRHRRPRVEQNITTSARITAGAAPAPAAAPPGPPQQRDSANPVSRVQEQLVRQLDWDTTLLSC